ncbi:MAG: putative amino acid-binding protein [Acidimicrobiaceae bacterium]|nr:putative amino acid-binding protein [Acidimicrobiaceae bacterium]
MARFTLHAVAPNQSGIVAAVTQALADIGCNLEDSRMYLLHGQFSIVLVLEAPDVSNGYVIEEALAPLLEELALQLFVRPIAEQAHEERLGDLVFVSVHGADHPGTVARIARAVAAAGGNIVDLVGHVVLEGGDAPSQLEFTAVLERASVPGLRSTLDALGSELDMRCEVREEALRP